MSQEVLFLLVILSMAVWIMVSKEAVKPSNKINRWKMITLLSAGCLSSLFITFTLFQSLL